MILVVDDVFLGGEVPEEGARRDARLLGDLLDGYVADPVPGEQAEGDERDLVGGEVASPVGERNRLLASGQKRSPPAADAVVP